MKTNPRTKKAPVRERARVAIGKIKVARFWLQPTKSFPDPPQRENYWDDDGYFHAERRYEQEWRETYECAGCPDSSCPQCGASRVAP
jgi:hypothetical protein